MHSDTNNGQSNTLKILDDSVASDIHSIGDKFLESNSTLSIEQLIDQIDDTVRKIDGGLVKYLTINQKKHQQDISNIELERLRLSSSLNSSNDLVQLLSSANDLGHPLTFEIKSLDKEIDSVKKTLDFVTSTQLLKNNLNQANFAIEHGNWVLAAQCIYNIKTRLPPSLVNGKYASVIVPSADFPESPGTTIDNWIAILTKRFQQGFNQAAEKREVPELTKYFQLFPLIQQEEVGLNCYAKFICGIIIETSRNLITSTHKDSSTEVKSGLYSAMSRKLFENVSTMLVQHIPLIRKYYSPSYPKAVHYVLAKIQNELDSQIGLIGDTFYDVRNVDALAYQTEKYNFPLLTGKLDTTQEHIRDADGIEMETTGDLSVIEVGDLVNEFSSILCNWILYCKFITVQFFKNDAGNDEDDESKLPHLLSDSVFAQKIINRYLPAYEKLYSYYFRRSLEKAISIEELPSVQEYLQNRGVSRSPDQAPCSSVVDDVALVFNNTLKNVIATGQLSAIKKFINESYTVLKSDMLEGYYVKCLNDNQPRYNTTLVLSDALETISGGANTESATRSNTPVPEAMGSMGFFKGATSALGSVVGSSNLIVSSSNNTSASTSRLIKFVLYLNSVATGEEYITKIFSNIFENDSAYLRSSLPFGKNVEIVTNTSKEEFIEPYKATCNKIIHDNLVNLFNQSIKNKLLILVNESFPDISESNYIIFSSDVVSDPETILRFISNWQSLMRPYKQIFHKTLIYNKLLSFVVINLANIIEKRLFAVLRKFKINEWGAIKLEKDLSSIINEVCEENYELREKFLRVTQLTLIVCMDDEEYELGMEHLETEDKGSDNESDINWVFTPVERKTIRKLRI